MAFEGRRRAASEIIESLKSGAVQESTRSLVELIDLLVGNNSLLLLPFTEAGVVASVTTSLAKVSVPGSFASHTGLDSEPEPTDGTELFLQAPGLYRLFFQASIQTDTPQLKKLTGRLVTQAGPTAFGFVQDLVQNRPENIMLSGIVTARQSDQEAWIEMEADVAGDIRFFAGAFECWRIG